MNFHGFSWIFIGFHGMSWIALGWDILADFGGIQLIILGGVWVPLAFVGSVGLFALSADVRTARVQGHHSHRVFSPFPTAPKDSQYTPRRHG